MSQPSFAYIKVTNVKTGTVRTYPTIALAAMDVRTTYPALCYQLARHGRVQVNTNYVVERVEPKRNSNRPLAVQIRNMSNGELVYFSSMTEAANFLGLSPSNFKSRLEGGSVFHHNDYRVYRIK